jgi:pilus assembly protein CpaC
MSFVDDLSTNDAVFEVTLGQARILTIKEKMKVPALVAIGDPSVIDFSVLNNRQIRILGQRIGVTDLSVIAADERAFNFEVRVVIDLDILRGKLIALYPDAQLKLTQVRDHLVVEGQARDATQVARILETIKAYQASVHATELRKIRQPTRQAQPVEKKPPKEGEPQPPLQGPVEQFPLGDIQATVPEPRLINLIRVPGPQQVLLKVRVAELNRTALRQIGADILSVDRKNGTIVGTQIGGVGPVNSGQSQTIGGILSGASTNPATTTIFGVFNRADFEIFIAALRRNSLLKILAEPNLIALNGHKASFLAGGKFPVPVAQSSSGGATPTVTVQFEPFGVSLDFTPSILDGDNIRLAVHPQVSSIDTALGTVLVPGGTPVPGLDTREAQTTVELKQGQTLAIAGLIQLTLDGTTSRIPGLGDLPVLGPFFSNTTSERIEKELIVLVTPYLVESMNPGEVPPTPGDEVKGPNDLEVYLLNRIEGRTGRDFRSTVDYECAPHSIKRYLKLEKDHLCGPHGFSD